jgi:hypothetical protein
MKTVACCRAEPNSAGLVIRQLRTSEEHNGFQVYAKVNADTGEEVGHDAFAVVRETIRSMAR